MTKGAERLRVWRTKRRKITTREVGVMLDVATNMISMLEHGARLPNLQRAVLIEKITSGFVRAEHWLEPASSRAAA